MYNRLIHYLNQNSIISNSQFGFRANHSTIHALLLTVDKIETAIEKEEYCCGVFLDLQKAFDSVNHEILLNKLGFYNITGIPHKWFKHNIYTVLYIILFCNLLYIV